MRSIQRRMHLLNIKFINWKVFSILYIASIIGIIAILPYALTLQADVLQEVPFPLPVLIGISILQSAVLFFIVVLAGMVLSKKIGLGTPILDRFARNQDVIYSVKSILGISIGLGVLVGVLIIIGDYLFSLVKTISLNQAAVPPVWQGFLTSFYGGINEELLLRFFFMSLLIYIFMKIKKTDNSKPNTMIVWVSIVLASIFFGLAHLPLTATLTEITPIIVARAVILNSIGGVVFGWLYWKKGLESAMISHFTADIVLHGLFPLFSLM